MWISVESKQKPFNDVLVYRPYGSLTKMVVAMWSVADECWYSLPSFIKLDGVTHWTYLPEKPEEV